MEPDEPRGRARGGHARAARMSPEERSDVAQKAARARWDEKLPRVLHRGELDVAGMKIACFVLDDGRRVISGRGMTTAIGMKGRGQGIARIADLKAINTNENMGLTVAIQTPILFTGDSSREDAPTHGFEATVLQEVCEALLKARDTGALKSEQEKRYGQHADMLIRAFARVGIVALVDEATGYQEVRPKDALQKYLEMLVRKDLAAWAKKFPDEFYENIYKLRGWAWPGMRVNRYSAVAQYTRDLVYERLAPGLLAELESKNPVDESGRRPNRLHQYLTDEVGDPLLAQHLHSLVMFQRLAIGSGYGWGRFVRMVDKVMPRRGRTLELPLEDVGLE